MPSGIYLITNTINGKVYVGKSRNLNNRLVTHKSRLRNGKHENLHLQRAWNTYGEQYFKFEVLEEIPISNLNEREHYWIHTFEALDESFGYNKEDPDPNSNSKVVSESTKEQISNTLRGVSKSPFSDKHKQRLSESHKGQIPWNKGMPTGKQSQTSSDKKSVAMRVLYASGFRNLTEVQRKAQSEKFSKPFRLISPDKKLIEGTNLTQFAKDNGLNRGNLCSVLNGKRRSHRGYTKPLESEGN